MTARVSFGGELSDPFEVLVGVKQGCVLAPVIFNLFLVAVTLFFRSNIQTSDGVPFNFRLDGNLFNLRRLQAKTKTSLDNIFDLQYADDAALPSHTPQGLQRGLAGLDDAYQRAGLSINTKKTVVMTTPVGTDASTHPVITVQGHPLEAVKQFTYLGTVITSDLDLSIAIQNRIRQASAAFGRLTQRVFNNHSLSTSTKVAVYKAICVSTMLYGSEAWTPYQRHIKTLEQYHIRCLQRILGLRWWHRIPHVEIRKRANIQSAEVLMLQRQLRWVGHVIRMPSDRLPHRLLYGELVHGERGVGRPFKRFSDHIKATLRRCDISPASLESLASDRDAWNLACKEGLARLAAQTERVAQERKARRTAAASSAPSGPSCPHCGRVCASDFGLRSHLRKHR